MEKKESGKYRKAINNDQVIKACPDFYNTVQHFRELYFNTHGIEISQSKATKLIDIKIKSVGGLKV